MLHLKNQNKQELINLACNASYALFNENHGITKIVNRSPTSTNYTFLESLGQGLSNPTYTGLISEVILIPHP